jgi:hypothetical protein
MFLSQIEPHRDNVLYTTHTGMQAFLLQATVSPTLCESACCTLGEQAP